MKTGATEVENGKIFILTTLRNRIQEKKDEKTESMPFNNKKYSFSFNCFECSLKPLLWFRIECLWSHHNKICTGHITKLAVGCSVHFQLNRKKNSFFAQHHATLHPVIKKIVATVSPIRSMANFQWKRNFCVHFRSFKPQS